MIPHHQVAVDMSDLLIPISNNPEILHLCRDIKRKQTYEIWEMDMLKNTIPEYVNNKSYKERIKTKLDLFKRRFLDDSATLFLSRIVLQGMTVVLYLRSNCFFTKYNC